MGGVEECRAAVQMAQKSTKCLIVPSHKRAIRVSRAWPAFAPRHGELFEKHHESSCHVDRMTRDATCSNVAERLRNVRRSTIFSGSIERHLCPYTHRIYPVKAVTAFLLRMTKRFSSQIITAGKFRSRIRWERILTLCRS